MFVLLYQENYYMGYRVSINEFVNHLDKKKKKIERFYFNCSEILE